MRGDHLTPSGVQVGWRGPPPHARGSPGVRAEHAAGTRPTPACAGITPVSTRGRLHVRAHPRMRGDHLVNAHAQEGLYGPPPHARGSQEVRSGRELEKGPTPACAGITAMVRSPRGVRRAHPRMRGDHGTVADLMQHDLGPPPHARGSPLRAGEAAGAGGPTPACAGITSRRRAPGRSGSAHPRMRGDHVRECLDDLQDGGPPPHARGSRPRLPQLPDLAGPTPACAGITSWRTAARSPRAAHPRMRGDHMRATAWFASQDGPPPHARGSLERRGVPWSRYGPTPACAGITQAEA